jgi:hypothetical protein
MTPWKIIQQPPLAAALTDALGANERIQPEMQKYSRLSCVSWESSQIS